MTAGSSLYHCLIAGLPELDLGSAKVWISSKEFRKQLEQEIQAEDFALVKLLFLRMDNDHLVDFIENGTFEEKDAANFGLGDFSYQVEQFDAILPEEDVLPPYMVDLLKQYMKPDLTIERVEIEREVADRYYDYLMEHGNDFLRQYTEFEYNISNLLAYMEAGNLAIDPWKHISGDTVFVKHLREDRSVTRAASAGFEMFNEITCYAELPFLSEKEMRYDEVRWRMIEEMAFFDEFTVNSILAYLLKILLIERWTPLVKEAGEEKLREMVDMARNSSREKMNETIQ